MGAWFGANEEALHTLALHTLQDHTLHLAANEAAEEAPPPTGYTSLTPTVSLSFFLSLTRLEEVLSPTA